MAACCAADPAGEGLGAESSASSHCLRVNTQQDLNTAGPAETAGTSKALRHASGSPLSSERVQDSTVQDSTGQYVLDSALWPPRTFTHIHETQEKAILYGT